MLDSLLDGTVYIRVEQPAQHAIQSETPVGSKNMFLHWGDVVGNGKGRLSCPAIHNVNGMRICLKSIKAVCLIDLTLRAMKCMLAQTKS